MGRTVKKLNPAHLESFISLINKGPYYRLLSMSLKEIGVGYSIVEVDIQNKHNHPFGGVHGGVYSSAIDTAAAWSIYCELDEDALAITLDINVTIMAPIIKSKLIVKGQRIKIGKTICNTEISAMNQGGDIVATGTSKLMVIRDPQTVKQVLNLSSYESLPPKFIE